MQVFGNMTNAIDSNKQIYQKFQNSDSQGNKAYLLNAYETDKVQYYNDEKAKQKQAKKKKNKILIYAFTGLTGLGLIGSVAFGLMKKKITPQEAIEQISNSNVANKVRPHAQKFINLFMNFDALKNDIWTQFSKKIKTIKVDTKIRKGYENLSRAENLRKFDKHHASILSYLNNLGIKQIPTYETWYKGMSEAVGENVAPKGRRISEVLFEGFKKQEGVSFKSRMKNGFATLWENGTKEIIADENLRSAGVYKNFAKGISGYLPDNIKLSDDLYSANPEKRSHALKELATQLRRIMEEKRDSFIGEQAQINMELHAKAAKLTNPDGVLKNVATNECINDKYLDLLSEELANDLSEMNKILTKGSEKTIEKVRDLHLGNASVDVLGMVGSAGLLGGAIATADTKEEKKSIFLDIGVQLLSAMAFSFIGGIKNISGLASAITGFAFGEAVAMGVKGVDKAVDKHKKKKELSMNA